MMRHPNFFTRKRPGAASRLICAALTVLFMAGCASLIPLPKELGLYNLTPKSTFPENLPMVEWQLIVHEPEAAGGLDASRIALRPTPTQLDYYADIRWTERAPKMVQTLLAESFDNTHKIVAVGRQSVGLRSDFDLRTELREFQAEYFTGSVNPQARIKISAKLVRQPRRDIVAARSFEAVETADSTDIASIVRAFDRAFGAVAKDLVVWTITAGEETYKKDE